MKAPKKNNDEFVNVEGFLDDYGHIGEISRDYMNASGAEKRKAKDEAEQIIEHEIPFQEGEIAKLEAELDSLLSTMTSMNKTESGWEARFDVMDDRSEALETTITDRSNLITGHENRLEVLAKIDNSVKRKINRLERQDARKDKRKNKKAAKKALRAKYGKGSDYRKAKKDVKQDIKGTKKTEIKEHGGSFLRRTVLKVNMTPIRLGGVALVRINLFGIATRLYPALLTDTELKAKHIKPSSKPKALRALAKAEQVFYNIGSKKETLHQLIRDGAKKKVAKWNKKDKSIGADGYLYAFGFDDAAYIASAIGAVATPIMAAMKKEGVDKNPFESGYSGDYVPTSEAEDNSIANEPDLSTVAGLEAAQSAILNDKTLTDAQKKAQIKALSGKSNALYYWIGGTLLVVGIAVGIYFSVKKKK